jgi:hypothetical protein
MNGKPWTREQLERLNALFPHQPAKEVAQAIGRAVTSVYAMAHKLGLKKTLAAVELQKQRFREIALADPRIIANRFKPGIVPWNKGSHYTAGGRSAETRFKPGQVSKRWDPEAFVVGALRINSDGGLDIKLHDGHRPWKQMCHYTWFLETGVWPPKGHVLRFRNGDNHDARFENLELLTMRENMRRNSLWNNFSPAMANLYRLKGAITRQVRRIEREGAQA